MCENRDDIWYLAQYNDDYKNSAISVAEVRTSPTNSDKLYIYTRVQRRFYVCVKCDIELPESHLMKHHSRYHSHQSFTMDMYYLFKTDKLTRCLACGVEMYENRFDDHNNQKHSMVQCNACQVSLKPNRMAKHEQRFHSSVQKSMNSSTSSDVSSTETVMKNVDFDPKPKSILGKMPIFLTIEMYKCKICGVNGLSEEHLEDHHLQNHQNVPFFTNIFKSKAKDYAQCICGLQMKTKYFDKHVEQFHPEKVLKENPKIKSVALATSPTSEKSEKSDSTVQSTHQSNMHRSLPLKFHTCQICHGQMSNFKKHQSKKHNNIPMSLECNETRQLIRCQFCKKERLKMHLERIHMEKSDPSKTNEPRKIFRCDLCSEQMFENRIVKHMRRMHPEDGDDILFKLYKCSIRDVDDNVEQMLNPRLEHYSELPVVDNSFNAIQKRPKCQVSGQVMMNTHLNEHYTHRGTNQKCISKEHNSKACSRENRQCTIHNSKPLEIDPTNDSEKIETSHKIRISNHEFERLVKQNRVHAVDGKIFLKDFK